MTAKCLTIAAARQMAHEELLKWGLSDWYVKMNPRLRRSLGRCRRKDKVIELALRHVQTDSPAEVLNTIRHEIAHALTKGGHTKAFYAMCLKMGAKPSRYGQLDRPFQYQDERPKYVCGCRCKTVMYKRLPSTFSTDSKGRVFTNFRTEDGRLLRRYRICPKCHQHETLRTVTRLLVLNHRIIESPS